MKANCVMCGGEFNGRNSRQKTCGAECSRQHRLKRNRENQRKRHATNPEKMNASRRRKYVPKMADCVSCGKTFHKRGPTITCSPECRKDRQRNQKKRNRAHIMRQCVICGKDFRKKNNAKTCGKHCSRELYLHTVRKWHQENRDYSAEQSRKHRLANLNYYREYHRRYYQANRDKILRRYRDWVATNKEWVRSYNRDYMRNRLRFLRAAECLGLPPLLYAAMKLKDRFDQPFGDSR